MIEVVRMKTILLFFLLCSTLLSAQTTSLATPSHRVARFVAPAYPWLARKVRIQGETISELRVQTDGVVETVNVITAHPMFQNYVQKALEQWIFESSSQPFMQIVKVHFVIADCRDIRSLNPDAYKETAVSADLPQFLEVKTCGDIVVTTTN
jgi:TonB-like protein